MCVSCVCVLAGWCSSRPIGCACVRPVYVAGWVACGVGWLVCWLGVLVSGLVAVASVVVVAWCGCWLGLGVWCGVWLLVCWVRVCVGAGCWLVCASLVGVCHLVWCVYLYCLCSCPCLYVKIASDSRRRKAFLFILCVFPLGYVVGRVVTCGGCVCVWVRDHWSICRGAGSVGRGWAGCWVYVGVLAGRVGGRWLGVGIYEGIEKHTASPCGVLVCWCVVVWCWCVTSRPRWCVAFGWAGLVVARVYLSPVSALLLYKSVKLILTPSSFVTVTV